MCKVVRMLALAMAAVATCSVIGPRLLAQAKPQPAPAFQIWTGSMVSDETAKDAVKELKPLAIVGTRNGAFSAKIVTESAQPIKGLRASAGDLTGKAGSIPGFTGGVPARRRTVRIFNMER